MNRSGATVDPRRGDYRLFLWEAEVIDRASPMTVAPGVTIRVPQTSDLILLKLAAGGFLDLRDAAALLALGERDALVRDIESHISDVHPDVRGAWRQVLTSAT